MALELFALTAVVVRAQHERADNLSALRLAEQFALDARRRIDDTLRDMWRNEDAERSQLARELLEGRFEWLERCTTGVPFGIEALRPETMQEFFRARDERGAHVPAPFIDGEAKGAGERELDKARH